MSTYPDETRERVVVGGIVYEIIAESPLGPLAHANDPEVKRLVTLRRPNGRKEKIGKDYGGVSQYGNHRIVIIQG